MATEKKSTPAGPTAPTESVTFAHAWRHGGKDYQAGDKSVVTKAAKAKLTKRGALQ